MAVGGCPSFFVLLFFYYFIMDKYFNRLLLWWYYYRTKDWHSKESYKPEHTELYIYFLILYFGDGLSSSEWIEIDHLVIAENLGYNHKKYKKVYNDLVNDWYIKEIKSSKVYATITL